MSKVTLSNYIDDDDVLLWGARAIGAAINLPASAVFPMLVHGRIICAVKRCGRWTAWRRQIRREFGIADARPANSKSAVAEAEA